MNQQTDANQIEERELLLGHAKGGDSQALESLFELCRPRLLAHARRILPRLEDAEDAVQDAMLSAFAHLGKFEGRAQFLTWATSIVINAAFGQIRRSRRKRMISWDQCDEVRQEAAKREFMIDPNPTAEEICQRAERKNLLEWALKQLSTQTRIAVEHCDLRESSLKDTADALGVSIGALKTRLHRGRRSLIVSIKQKTHVRRRIPGDDEGARPQKESTQHTYMVA